MATLPPSHTVHRPPAIDTRGTQKQRGYGHKWRRLRGWYIKRHPLCIHCEALGKTKAAAEVDHIEPFNGPLDPLRLDTSNLQSLCIYHHRVKHGKKVREGGTSGSL